MKPLTTTELRKVIALRDLPEKDLQWILDHGEYKEYEDGAIASRTGEPIDYMWMILEGKGNFYLDISGRLVHYYTFENNDKTGGVGGLLPYSRMKTAPGFTFIVGKGRIFLLHKKYFQQLEQLNPAFIQRLIGYMTERARTFATLQLQQEKVNELGKLSAGIAHELNNPASAITRISSELNRRLMLNYELTEKLLQYKINPEQVRAIHEKSMEKNQASENNPRITAIQKLEKEDEIRNWLEEKKCLECVEGSETFVEAGWNVADLENVLQHVGSEALSHVMRWLENLLASGLILKDLEEASSRISTLVGAIKSHVHMDRTNDWLPTNIHTGIENTLVLLGHKIREKNITVKKLFCESLPAIDGFVGELNQVWSNLADNAIYAMDQNGELVVETTHNDDSVTIRFIDNGRGIPPEISTHIFDPYFTTKHAGEGSGIGLDIVNRIIKNHNGNIVVSSEPGRTEFKITLPISQANDET